MGLPNWQFSTSIIQAFVPDDSYTFSRVLSHISAHGCTISRTANNFEPKYINVHISAKVPMSVLDKDILFKLANMRHKIDLHVYEIFLVVVKGNIKWCIINVIWWCHYIHSLLKTQIIHERWIYSQRKILQILNVRY